MAKKRPEESPREEAPDPMADLSQEQRIEKLRERIDELTDGEAVRDPLVWPSRVWIGGPPGRIIATRRGRRDERSAALLVGVDTAAVVPRSKPHVY